MKFPRGNRTAIDQDILRAEYHYYHALADLGVSTIDTEKMMLKEGDRYPSLWLPRFDVDFEDGEVVRYGLESVYSILEKEPGAPINHFDAIRNLCGIFGQLEGTPFSSQEFVNEWVYRDFLSVVFGNSDNHGRNTAFIKKPGVIELSPIYDFAPMRADPEGVIRITTWGSPFEEGGNFDWIGIANGLQDVADPELIISKLKEMANMLSGLKENLRARGVPESILNMPIMRFDTLDKRLAEWGLI